MNIQQLFYVLSPCGALIFDWVLMRKTIHIWWNCLLMNMENNRYT